MCERAVICFGQTVPNTIDTQLPSVVFQNNLCVAKCDNFPTASYFPSNPGNWSWSSFNGCTKQVICAPGSLPINITTTPTYTWGWNDFQNKCTTTQIKCDNNSVFGTLTQNANSYGPWQWSTASGCRRVGYCGSTNQSVNYDYGVFSVSPCFGPVGARLAYVKCDGFQTNETVACTGANENQVETRSFTNKVITYFPNPVKSSLTVHGLDFDSGGLTYKIFSINGALITFRNLSSEVINLEDIPAGQYNSYLR